MFSNLFKTKTGPSRIKSLRELRPGFKPRWFKYEIRLVLTVMIWFFGLMGLLPFIGGHWFALLFMAGLFSAVFVFGALSYTASILALIGYYFPKAAVLAARLDIWLERDLDWDNNRR